MRHSSHVCALVLAASMALPPRYAFAAEPMPAQAPSDRARAESLKARADDLVEQGMLAEAVEQYGLSIAAAPDPRTHYNRGRALASLGQYPAAVKDLEIFQRTASPELRERVSGLPEFLARIRSRVSAVSVTCNIAGAEVKFRGVVVGTTPLNEDIVVTSGAATLEVQKEGYFSYRRDFDFPGGGRSVIEANLASRATAGVVRITSPVVGSRVAIDDKPMGTVPLETPLALGSHRIVLTHEGYEPASTLFQVEAGTSGEVRVPLEKEPSVLRKWWFWTAVGVGIAAGGGAIYALTTERSLEKGSLAPGNYTIGFRGL